MSSGSFTRITRRSQVHWEAGRRTGTLFEEFSDSGQNIIDNTDRQTPTLAAIDEDFARIDRILDDEI